VLLLLLAIPLGALPGAGAAEAKVVWLCKPGLASNPCRASLNTTMINADGAMATERARPARRPKIDCFYVYPTVSGQPGLNATKAKDPEVRFVARAQASRFSRRCRVFVPVYREITVAAVLDPGNLTGAAARIAYGDVLEAWRQYLRRHNNGRGVVLIGDSQGSWWLRRLVAREIDKHPRIRRRLVSTLLLGGDVTVRRGSDRGGDFRNVPACRRESQTGCVVAYSSFYGEPPADSMFGRAQRAGREVLCVNPAALSGERGALEPYFPTEPVPGPLGLVSDKAPPGFATWWASTPGLYSARCRSRGGATWLDIDDAGGAGDARFRVTESLGPAWGLHLVDVSLALGNLVDLVGRQTAAYLRR